MKWNSNVKVTRFFFCDGVLYGLGKRRKVRVDKRKPIRVKENKVLWMKRREREELERREREKGKD